MGNVTATVQIQFQAVDDGGVIKAEIDSRSAADGGLNPRGTSFRPGDAAGFLVFQSGFSRVAFSSSSGQVGNAGTGILDKEEYLIYTDGQLEQSVSYPINSIVSMEWLGRSGGVAAQVSGDPQVIRSDGLGDYPAVLRVRYKTAYTGHRLSGVPLDYPVAVVVAIGVP